MLIRQQLDVLDQYIKDNRSCIVHTGKNFINYVLIKRLVKCKEKPHFLSCLIFMATFNKRKITFPAWFLWSLSTKEKSHFLHDFYGHFQHYFLFWAGRLFIGRGRQRSPARKTDNPIRLSINKVKQTCRCDFLTHKFSLANQTVFERVRPACQRNPSKH